MKYGFLELECCHTDIHGSQMMDQMYLVSYLPNYPHISSLGSLVSSKAVRAVKSKTIYFINVVSQSEVLILRLTLQLYV